LLWYWFHHIGEEELRICGFENLAQELEQLVQTNIKQKEGITSTGAQDLSDVGLVGEIWKQLCAYRPRIFSLRGDRLLAAQQDCDMGRWIANIHAPMRSVSKCLTGDVTGDETIRFGAVGDISSGKFEYPVGKRRTKQTNEAMQRTEQNLDGF
jgi:hypothetical protein